MDAKPPSDSRATLVRWMGIEDANHSGLVHGGVVMKPYYVDEVQSADLDILGQRARLKSGGRPHGGDRDPDGSRSDGHCDGDRSGGDSGGSGGFHDSWIVSRTPAPRVIERTVTPVVQERNVYQEVPKKRSWQKSALVIGGSAASDRSSIGRASPVAPLAVLLPRPRRRTVHGASPVGTIHQSRHSGTGSLYSP